MPACYAASGNKKALENSLQGRWFIGLNASNSAPDFLANTDIAHSLRNDDNDRNQD
jgi:hypothetical protein